jgi:hypothetical protein
VALFPRSARFEEVSVRRSLLGWQRLAAAAAIAGAVVAGCGRGTPIGASPKTPFPSASSPTDLGRIFVLALGETRYVTAEGDLSQAFATALPEAALKAKWEVLATQDGKFKSVGDPTSAPASGAGLDVAVPVTFAGGNEVVHVTVDPTALKVTGVDIPKGSGHNPVLDESGRPGSSASPAASPSGS